MDHGAAHAPAQPRGRRFLEPVSLVEDDRVVLRKDRGRVGAAAKPEIGEVQGVVDDDQLGMGGALARGLREAERGEHAAATEAAVRPDGDLRPDRIGRLDLELGAVARLGQVDPAAHPVEGGGVLGPREELSAEKLEPMEGVPAQVVLAALEHRHLHLAAQRLGGGRDVLAEELLLEGLRRGRDHHPLSRVECGDQVREALAGARAGLGDEVLPGRERDLDLGRERSLLRAGLVAGEDTLQAPAGLEEPLHARQRTERCGRRNACSPRRASNVRNVRMFRA